MRDLRISCSIVAVLYMIQFLDQKKKDTAVVICKCAYLMMLCGEKP